MDIVTNSFAQLYTSSKETFVSCHKNCISIVETDSDSTFNELNIESPGDSFFSIDNSFYRDLYDGKSSVLGNVNCDGIVLVKHGEQKILLMVELKSNLDADKISLAFQQEVRSFLKLNSSLSLCNGYNISDFVIRGVIACHPFKTEDARTKCLHNLQLEMELGKKDARFKYRMVNDKRINTRFADCAWFIPSNALSDNIKNHEFSIVLALGEKYEDSSETINLEDITKAKNE